MKKILVILGSIAVIVAFVIGYNFLYRNYRTATANAGTYESETETLKERNRKLRVQRKKNNKYIKSQKNYIGELTQKIAALETGQNQAEDTADDETDVDGVDSYDESQDLYADLYAQEEYNKRFPNDTEETDTEETPVDKTVYLTFDDGPSSITPQVLDLLDEYDAKATFFVVYREEYAEYLTEIINRGHTLALHSYSHDYDTIYDSLDAYLADFKKIYDWVFENTGQRPTLYRFPGGSLNGSDAVMDTITAEMERRGFIYYDWNVSSGDGSNLTTSTNIIDNICDNVDYFDTPVVLMHDGVGKNATLNALPTVLQNLKDDGYSFEVISEDMEPIQY